MKFFNSIRKSSEIVGIYHHQVFEKHSINLKNYVIMATLALNIILSGAFFLFEAQTFSEYSESFYGTSFFVLVFVFIEEFIRNNFATNELITNLENTIQKRMYFKSILFEFLTILIV